MSTNRWPRNKQPHHRGNLIADVEDEAHQKELDRKERNFNADGSIERMKMKPVSAENDFSYDFADLNFTPVKQQLP